MATATQVPLETYLHTAYSPDCDYVDGEVRERNVGEREHSRAMVELASRIWDLERRSGVCALLSLRVQVSPTRFRVPDITVLRADAPDEQIITHPPLIAIEILSPSDSFAAMREKIDDYVGFGILHIWVVDPADRMGYVCRSGQFRDWQPTRQLAVPGTEILLDLAALPA